MNLSELLTTKSSNKCHVLVGKKGRRVNSRSVIGQLSLILSSHWLKMTLVPCVGVPGHGTGFDLDEPASANHSGGF